MREGAKRLFDVVVGGGLIDAEQLVVIGCHGEEDLRLMIWDLSIGQARREQYLTEIYGYATIIFSNNPKLNSEMQLF